MNWLDKMRGTDPAAQDNKEKQREAMKQLRAEGNLPLSSAKIEGRVQEIAAKEKAAREKEGADKAKELLNTPKTASSLSMQAGQQIQFYTYVPKSWSSFITGEPAPQKPLEPELTVVEAVTGWRRWSVEMFGCELRSNNGVPWKPYEKLIAECKAKGPSIFDPAGVQTKCKGVRCTCGIYAYKEPTDAKFGENAPKDVTHVWGEVYLWGRVIEHSKGWRGQFAYPKSFVDSGGIARQLAAAYGVKVIQDTFKRPSLCGCPDDAGIMRQVLPDGGEIRMCTRCGWTDQTPNYYSALQANMQQLQLQSYYGNGGLLGGIARGIVSGPSSPFGAII